MTPERLRQLHEAAKFIEIDRVEAIRTTTAIVGEDVAMALLVAHIRRNLGSTDTFPCRDGIIEEVNSVLAGAGII